jgi:probable phosphoglycerate mutase
MSAMILIVRHGETSSNAKRVIQTPDTPLSERGSGQARRLGLRLAEVGVERMLSSDLARAHMTAESVRAATGVEPELEPLLQERNFGDIRGRAYDDLGFDLFADDYAPPGGEDWPEFHARVDRAWQRILAAAVETEGNLAVITHGLVCRSIALRHVRLPDDEPAPLGWANTSLTIVEKQAPHAVRLLNCTAHLRGERADTLSGA